MITVERYGTFGTLNTRTLLLITFSTLQYVNYVFQRSNVSKTIKKAVFGTLEHWNRRNHFSKGEKVKRGEGHSISVPECSMSFLSDFWSFLREKRKSIYKRRFF